MCNRSRTLARSSASLLGGGGPLESFFASLKKELVHDAALATRAEARAAIVEYIEVFDNSQRQHSSLGTCPRRSTNGKTVNPLSTFRGELHFGGSSCSARQTITPAPMSTMACSAIAGHSEPKNATTNLKSTPATPVRRAPFQPW
jgi:hypothetical protein